MGIIKVQPLILSFFLSVSVLFKKRKFLKAGIFSVSGDSRLLDVKMIWIYAGPFNCHCKLDKVAVGFITVGGKEKLKGFTSESERVKCFQDLQSK